MRNHCEIKCSNDDSGIKVLQYKTKKGFRYEILFLFAREERLELPTPGFGDQCSTN